MALGAFVTDAKCTTCSRRFSIQRTVLRMRGLLRLKSSSRSTHVLMKRGCLFVVSASSAQENEADKETRKGEAGRHKDE